MATESVCHWSKSSISRADCRHRLDKERWTGRCGCRGAPLLVPYLRGRQRWWGVQASIGAFDGTVLNVGAFPYKVLDVNTSRDCGAGPPYHVTTCGAKDKGLGTIVCVCVMCVMLDHWYRILDSRQQFHANRHGGLIVGCMHERVVNRMCEYLHQLSFNAMFKNNDMWWVKES